MKKIKKRGAIYGVIALLLCVAVYLNWSYIDAPEDLLVAEQTDPEDAAASAQDAADGTDYFAASRLTREQARDEAVSTLKELSESEEADQTAKDEAAAQISALAEDSVAEANIESLIRAKGYEDAVVMIGDDSVNAAGGRPAGRGRYGHQGHHYLRDRHVGRPDQDCRGGLIGIFSFFFAKTVL